MKGEEKEKRQFLRSRCKIAIKKVHKQFPTSQSKDCPKVALRFPRAFQIGLP